MRTVLRLILLLVVLIPVLGLLGLAVLPAVINWDGQAARLEKTIEQKSGYKTKLSGIDVSIFPKPLIKIDTVRVKAFHGKDDIFTAKKLHMELDPADLLIFSINVNHFSLENPQINLVRYEDGKANWLAKRKSRHSQSPGASPIANLGHVSIRKGNLLYTDKTTNVEHKITDFRATLKAEDLRKAHLKLSGKLNQIPLSTTATIDMSSLLSIRGKATLSLAKSTLKLNGIVVDPMMSPAYSGQIDFDGPDFVDTLYQLSGKGSSGKIFNVPIKLKGVGRFHGEEQGFSDVSFQLADINFKGRLNHISPRGSKPRKIKIDLATSKTLDLNALGICTTSVLEEDASPSQAKKQDTPWSSDLIDTTPLRNLELDLNYKFSSLLCGEKKFVGGSILLENQQNVMSLHEFKLATEDTGSILVKGRMESLDPIVAQLNLRVENLPLAAFASKKLTNYFDTRLHGESELGFTGNSVQEWMNGLKGRVLLRAKEGSIAGFDMANFLGTVKNILLGQNVKTSNNTHAITKFLGTFLIQNGILTTEQLILDAGSLKVQGTGKLDLANWKSNFRISPQHKGKIVVPILIKGSLNSPVIVPEVTSRAMGAGIGAAVGGPVGAGVGAVLGGIIDKNNPDGEQKKPEQKPNSGLPFDLLDSDNLRENLREYLQLQQ